MGASMADKTIWICGGERGWAVRMDGRVLEAGLPIETAMTRAKKMAAFIEEGDQSVELRIMQADGSWLTVMRRAAPPPYRPSLAWATGLLRAG